jgi:hypothetical protein
MGVQIPSFRSNAVSSSSREWIFLGLQIRKPFSLKTPEFDYSFMQHHILEEWKAEFYTEFFLVASCSKRYENFTFM